MDRESLKSEFLLLNNLSSAQKISLQKDASHRSYDRLITEDNSRFIVMDAPPEHEELDPFIKVAEYLASIGLSTPKIFAIDQTNGYLLLEDFGDDKYTSILQGKSSLSEDLSEEEIYSKAIDCLIHLHQSPIKNITLPMYDETKLIKESKLFVQYYLEILNSDHIDLNAQDEYTLIMKHLIEIGDSFAKVVVLRDYHADNLMWLNDRTGIAKVGLLDFQDALIGSPVYDLISLLEDARRDVSPNIVEKMINRYLQAFPRMPRKEFIAAYNIFAVQRNLKIVGFIARQASVYKNPRYLALLPRVWRHINNDLKHPLLLPLKKWLEKTVPLQLKY
jgi:N-acetylmuramate 1-kinase